MTPEQRARKNELQRAYDQRRADRRRAQREKMTPEQRARKNEVQRNYARRHPDRIEAARDREADAFRLFVSYRENSEEIRAARAAREAANPELRQRKRETDARRRRRLREAPTESFIEREKRHSRRRHIRLCKDRAAFDRRVVERAEAAVPRTLPDDVRSGVIALLIERVYAGELPARITAAHGKAALADYRRQSERFSYDTVSLDTTIGENGFTRGHAMGVY